MKRQIKHTKVLALVNQARKASCLIFKSIPQIKGVFSAEIMMRNPKCGLGLSFWNLIPFLNAVLEAISTARIRQKAIEGLNHE